MFDTYLEDVMKKLISLVIAAAVSVSILGCAEKKAPAPAAPAAPAPGAEAKPDAPAEPAPATEEKK